MSSIPSFIIPNFFHTVQNSAITLFSKPASGTQTPVLSAQNKIIKKLAGCHLLAAAVMTAGTLTCLAALPYVFTATLGFAAIAALGVAIYAVGHDVFVFTSNIHKPQSAMQQLGQAIINTGVSPQAAQAKVITDGMFFQPIAVAIINKKAAKAAAAAAAPPAPATAATTTTARTTTTTAPATAAARTTTTATSTITSARTTTTTAPKNTPATTAARTITTAAPTTTTTAPVTAATTSTTTVTTTAATTTTTTLSKPAEAAAKRLAAAKAEADTSARI